MSYNRHNKDIDTILDKLKEQGCLCYKIVTEIEPLKDIEPIGYEQTVCKAYCLTGQQTKAKEVVEKIYPLTPSGKRLTLERLKEIIKTSSEENPFSNYSKILLLSNKISGDHGGKPIEFYFKKFFNSNCG